MVASGEAAGPKWEGGESSWEWKTGPKLVLQWSNPAGDENAPCRVRVKWQKSGNKIQKREALGRRRDKNRTNMASMLKRYRRKLVTTQWGKGKKLLLCADNTCKRGWWMESYNIHYSSGQTIFNERIFLCLPHEKCVKIFGDSCFVVLVIHMGIVREQSTGQQHAIWMQTSYWGKVTFSIPKWFYISKSKELHCVFQKCRELLQVSSFLSQLDG